MTPKFYISAAIAKRNEIVRRLKGDETRDEIARALQCHPWTVSKYNKQFKIRAPSSSTPWNDKMVEKLKKLWADGLSAGQIADRIPGVTRNAVIGKVHRLGLEGRNTRSRKPSSKRQRRPPEQSPWRGYRPRKKKPMPEFELAPLPPAAEYDVARKTLQELGDRECHWPISDPKIPGPLYCAVSPCVRGTDYCEVHFRRMFAGPTPRCRGSAWSSTG